MNATPGPAAPYGAEGSLRLSERWFGVRWADHFPQACGDVTMTVAEADEAITFLTTYWHTLFGDTLTDGRWTADGMTPAKRRFYEDADVFAFRRRNTTIGIQVSHPSDWNTYYVRTIAILPEFRGRGLLQHLTGIVAAALAAKGVYRLEGDIPPTNVANVLAQTRLGYVATGTLNTDRWGCVVRYTKYLEGVGERVFQQQFCAGIWPPLRAANRRAEGSTS